MGRRNNLTNRYDYLLLRNICNANASSSSNVETAGAVARRGFLVGGGRSSSL